jgi:tyrosyl-tRNA synthetase
MSKSRGNYIGIAEPPANIYGKTMSIPDGIIMQYFELLTDVPDKELKEFKRQLDRGANPMSLKKRLARELVTQFYSAKDAEEAEAHFEKTVQKKEIPDEVREFRLSFKALRFSTGEVDVRKLLRETGTAASASEASRLINQGAVEIGGKKVTKYQFQVASGSVVKVGKHRFVKVINTD